MQALVEAAFPLTSVEPLLLALRGAAYSSAFTLLFLVTRGFSGLTAISVWLSPDIEHSYTDEVMRRLDHPQISNANMNANDTGAHVEYDKHR